MRAKCYFLDGKLINIGEWDTQRRLKPITDEQLAWREANKQLVPREFTAEEKERIVKGEQLPPPLETVWPEIPREEYDANPIPAGVVIEEREVVQNGNGLFLVDDYASQRRFEYPPIPDQLDAFWKGGEDAEVMRARVLAVKAKYPKG